MLSLVLVAIGAAAPGAARSAGGRAAAVAAAAAVRWLADRLADPSGRTAAALGRAADRAWDAVEAALADESVGELLDRAEDRTLRGHLRAAVTAAGADAAGALADLRAARRGGFLAVGVSEPDALADRIGEAARVADAAGLVRLQATLADRLADDLRAAGFPRLAAVVGLRPADDADAPPLLAAAVRYHFRREVEDDPKLFQGVAFSQLERLERGQAAGVQVLSEQMARYADRVEDRLGELWDAAAETRADMRALKHNLARLAPHDAEVIELALADPTPTAEVYGGHAGAVVAVAAAGGRLLTAGADRTLRVWDRAGRKLLRTIAGLPAEPVAVGFHAGGPVVALADGGLRGWAAEADRPAFALDRVLGGPAAVSADGRLAVGGSPYDGKLRVFDLARRAESRRLPGHADWVTAVAFSPDARLVASAGRDGAVKVTDVATGRVLRTLAAGGATAVAFLADARRLAVASADGVAVWDTFTGRRTGFVPDAGDVTAVAGSPRTASVLVGRWDGGVTLWDVRAAAGRGVCEAGPAVRCVGFAADGGHVLAGFADGTARAWVT